MADFNIVVGGEADLEKFKRPLGGYDRITIVSCWRRAKRLKHLLVLFEMAGGWTSAAIIPPKEFSLETHRVSNKYKTPFFIGHNIKRGCLFVFGVDEAIAHLLKGAANVEENDGPGTGRSSGKGEKPGKGSRGKRKASDDSPQ